MHPRIRRWWRDFWRSPVSAAVDPGADAERLYQWVRCMQDREELMTIVRDANWVVPGSQSWLEEVVGGELDGGFVRVRTVVAHPLLGQVKHLDAEISRLADHFGMTPLSRFRLQITYADAKQGELNLRRRLMREEREQREGNVIDLDGMQ